MYTRATTTTTSTLTSGWVDKNNIKNIADVFPCWKNFSILFQPKHNICESKSLAFCTFGSVPFNNS